MRPPFHAAGSDQLCTPVVDVAAPAGKLNAITKPANMTISATTHLQTRRILLPRARNRSRVRSRWVLLTEPVNEVRTIQPEMPRRRIGARNPRPGCPPSRDLQRC